MPKRHPLALLLIAAVAGASLAAGAFGNAPDSSSFWADTPHGRFTCELGKPTQNKQVLKLGNKVLFDERSARDGINEGQTLASGLQHEGTGCPEVIASERGFVVLRRDVQPPHYGASGYAVVDFNASEPQVVRLGIGHRAKDEHLSDDKRLSWSDKMLTLDFIGFTEDQDCCTSKSPKPARHRVAIDLLSMKVRVLK
jgi:hypothetical protein